jgi:hypothetical protein
MQVEQRMLRSGGRLSGLELPSQCLIALIESISRMVAQVEPELSHGMQ